MLVTELKDFLKNHAQDELIDIICEVYKVIPKEIREEKDIDGIIKNIKEIKEKRKEIRANMYNVNMVDLEIEITEFLQHAYKRNYYVPNKYIQKKDRGKWKVKVRSYIKSLWRCPYDDEHARTAVELLEKLYEMLSYACTNQIFGECDPFRTINIKQIELLKSIITRRMAVGTKKEAIKEIIFLIINSNISNETTAPALMSEFITHLNAVGEKEIAARQCLALKKEFSMFIGYAKRLHTHADSGYRKLERFNWLAELYFVIRISMHEYEEAIDGLKKLYRGRDTQEEIHKLLYMLFSHNLPEYWVNEYENAIESELIPNEYQKAFYEYVKEHKEFPKRD